MLAHGDDAQRRAEYLPKTEQTEHFLIKYAERNVPEGRGPGLHGVRPMQPGDAAGTACPVLIRQYGHALEKAYAILRQEHWDAPHVRAADEQRALVLVCDCGYPRTLLHPDGSAPYMLLPCRTKLPSVEAALDKAEVDAGHEVFHLFSARYQVSLGHSSWVIQDWEWFDDAMAVDMERRFFPGNTASLCYGMDWVDQPELSLDSHRFRYEQGLFLTYLRKTLGPEFLREVWRATRKDELPLDVLERLLRERNRLLAHPTKDDVFGAGYCVDSFFVSELEPRIYTRYSGRLLRECFTVQPGRDYAPPEYDTLNHLACRYYYFRPQGATETLTVKLLSTVKEGCGSVKGILVPVLPDGRRGAPVYLELWKPAVNNGAPAYFHGKLPDFSPDKMAYAVLVVCNCGRRHKGWDREAHDDDQAYHFTARA